MSEREPWLTRAVQLIDEKVFKPLKLGMPDKWAVSCGWARGSTAKTLGVCVDPSCSADGTTHLFVVPTEFEGIKVLETLTHEMVHAIVGLECNHGGNFVAVCKALEMQKPWTKCGPVPGTECHNKLLGILQELGAYPHAALVPRKKPSPGVTEHRWISRRNPKYGVLISTGTVVKLGRPKDPWGEDMLPKYPARVFGAAPVNPGLKDMYELPTKNAGVEASGDEDSDD